MAFSGSSAPKMAVPATMTLLPWRKITGASGLARTGFPTQQHTGVSAYTDCFRSNTAVNFDIFIWEPRTQLRYLWHTSIQELLATLA